MRPTILLFPIKDDRFMMKFILRGEVYDPTTAYFKNVREAIHYCLTNTDIKLETFGLPIRIPFWLIMDNIIDGILANDGSITSNGKTIDIFHRRADQWKPPGKKT